jgi:hypothetical protein
VDCGECDDRSGSGRSVDHGECREIIKISKRAGFSIVFDIDACTHKGLEKEVFSLLLPILFLAERVSDVRYLFQLFFF